MTHALRRGATTRSILLTFGLWLGASLGACIDADFDRASLVKTARVLSIVVDPPVAGIDVAPTFTALVVDATGSPLRHDPSHDVIYNWRACLVPESVPGLQGMQYDADGNQQGCGGAMSIALTVDDAGAATMPAGLLPRLLATLSLDDVAQVLGLPVTLLMEALDRTGVILTVELHVEAPQQPALVAFKRVVLVNREQAQVIGSNPPPPRFSVRERADVMGEGTWLSARNSDDATTCTWEAQALQLRAGQRYILDPVDVPDEQQNERDWREPYEVINLTGEFQTLTEQPYYAWYATNGRLDQEQTTTPADEEIWIAPSEPGRYPLWLVVRDGHAGMSACRAEIDVVAP